MKTGHHDDKPAGNAELQDALSALQRAQDELVQTREALEQKTRQLENALAQNENRYRTLFDLSLSCILLQDECGTILEVNQALCRLFGYSRDELIGKNVRILIPPAHHHAVDRHIAEILSGKTLEHEVENIARDGSIRRVELRETAIRLDDGRQGILVTAEDVTARRRAESQIRLLAHALASTNEMISITDVNDRFTYVNRAFLNTYGYAEAEILGRTPEILFSAKNPSGLAAEILSNARGEGWSGEVLDRRKDGSEFYIYLNASPIRDGNGEIIGLMGIARDIHVQKLAAASLTESEERFRAMFECAAVGIAVVSLDGRFTRVNPKLCSITGYTSEALLGRALQEIIHPDDLHRHRKQLQQLLCGRIATYTSEKRYVHKDGSVVWTAVTVSLVRTAGGQPDYLIAVIEDITVQRTLEMQLRHAQKMEAIGQLAGGIAHDLNNALAPIVMGAAMLKTEYPAAREIVEMCETSANRAADMVRQLLTFANKRVGVRSPLRIAGVVSGVEAILRNSLPKTVSLQVAVENNLPLIVGDSGQLQQALLNLCVNASDAMPRGGTIFLRIFFTEVDEVLAREFHSEAGRYIAAQVSDTGHGISSEIIDRIFEPFFTTKAPNQGSGLGLSTVLGIVKWHDGFLQVSSPKGAGATFTAYLPVADLDQPSSVERPDQPFRGQGETILVVDDEPAVRTVAQAVLARMNLKAVMAKDGADALRKAAEHEAEIRAVITDLHMPNMDGLRFVRAIRQTLPTVPIAIASGRMEMVDDFKALGVDARLDKPFSQKQLEAVLKEFFGPRE